MANRIHNAFDSIKADERLKQSTKQYISAKHKEKTRIFRKPAFRRTAAAVCVICALALGINGYLWVRTPVSYISIDVNPSIELALNRFNRVVSAEAYNEEAEEILKGLSLKWKEYTEAMAQIVDGTEMNVYLTDGSELVFTVAADGGRNEELKSEIENYCGNTGRKCHSYSADTEIVDEAHGNGLSLGKYYAYLQLYQYDDTVTVDDCKGMSASHIHGLAQRHAHGRADVDGQDAGDNVQGGPSAEGTGASQNGGHHQRRRHGH